MTPAAEPVIYADGTRVAWWQKDGAYHYTLPYEPTAEDRKNYPTSFPPGSDGPFFQWDGNGYDTAQQAEDAKCGAAAEEKT